MSKYPEALQEIENEVNSNTARINKLKILIEEHQKSIDSLDKEKDGLEQLVSRLNAARQLLLDNDDKEDTDAP